MMTPENGGAGHPAPPFCVLRASKRLPRDLIDGAFQTPWAKKGKYEYCHLFSNSQNHLKRPLCGPYTPLN
ncbi:hypothetical protein DW870_03385 [Collinsella sp. AM38-1BH]|nr:hypothetical protein DW870_03385 [Collinsella sp. AM38-1BH]